MILTKEAQEALISNYVKSGKNQDECIGFIEGVEAMNKIIGDSSKIEPIVPYSTPYLLSNLIKALETIETLATELNYNSSRWHNEHIEPIKEAIEKATK